MLVIASTDCRLPYPNQSSDSDPPPKSFKNAFSHGHSLAQSYPYPASYARAGESETYPILRAYTLTFVHDPGRV